MNPDGETTLETCHSERSEESSMIHAGGHAAGFFTSFRMTDMVLNPIRANP
jgi:hypothetical protein